MDPNQRHITSRLSSPSSPKVEDKLGALNQTQKLVIYTGLGILILGLGLFAYLGIFNRYYADDWCYNKDLDRLGMVGVLQGYTYIKTYASNRYALSLFSGLIYALGVSGVQVMTPVMILAWLGGIFWTLHELKKAACWSPPPLIIALITALIVYFSTSLAPHLYQNMYWRSGLLPYTAPIVLGTYVAGAIIRQARRDRISIPLIVASALMALLVGGFSEAASTYQVTGLGVYFVVVLVGLQHKQQWARRSVWIVGITLLFAILALCLEILSPANAARQLHSYGEPTSLIELPKLALVYTYFYIRVTTSTHLLAFGIVFLLSMVLAILSKLRIGKPGNPISFRRAVGLMLISGTFTYLLIAASLTPSLYIEGGLPAPRALIIPLFTLVFATVFLGWIVGSYLLSSILSFGSTSTNFINIIQAISILLLCLGYLYIVDNILDTRDNIKVYAERATIWDERDAYLRTAASEGAEEADVYGIDSAPIGGLNDLKPDGKHWVNRCAAQYYGLKIIRASKGAE